MMKNYELIVYCRLWMTYERGHAGTDTSNGWIEANHLFFAIILWEVRKIGPSSKVGCSCGLQQCVTHWLTKLMTHELSSPFTGNPAATPWPSSNTRYHLLPENWDYPTFRYIVIQFQKERHLYSFYRFCKKILNHSVT